MKTVVGLFDDFTQAQSAMRALEQAGIPHSDIGMVASNETGRFNEHAAHTTTTVEEGNAVGTGATAGTVIGGLGGLAAGLGLLAIPGFGPIAAAGWFVATITGAGIGALAGGLIGALVNIGIPHEEASYYSEGVRRGGTLLTIKCEDNMADRVAGILGDHGAVDIDERAATYRQEGFLPTPAASAKPVANTTASRPVETPVTPPVAPRPMTPPAQPAMPVQAREGEIRLPVVEEEIQVGKRQVQGGGVRVYSHVTEKPVEETVQLHEEHVNVERHPVNRAINPADVQAFKEQTMEVTEMSEVPVIAKQARVVEEVVVNKEATDRTETIHETVRRTDVEVEPLGHEHMSRTSAYETYDADFRNHYRAAYGTSGAAYEEYSPAYRYGYDLSSNDRYRSRDWASIEPDVRRDWESRMGNTWDRFKDSVRYAWDKATGAERGGVKTGGYAVDGTPDTRGVTEKVADAITGDRLDDKTGKPVL